MVKGGIRLVVNDGDFGTSDAEIDRPFVPEHGPRRRLARGLVGRHQDCEAGQCAGQGDVLDSHLRGAVLADGDPGVAADDLDVQPGIGHRHPQLLEGVAHDEDGEAGDDRRLAARRQAACDTHQVALGDPDVEKAVRVFLAEPLGAGRVGHVGVDHDYIGVFGSEGHQGVPEGVAGRLAQRLAWPAL